jgi:hypothetical protein
VHFDPVERQNCCTASTSLERNECGSITLNAVSEHSHKVQKNPGNQLHHSSPLSGLTLMFMSTLMKMTGIGLSPFAHKLGMPTHWQNCGMV